MQISWRKIFLLLVLITLLTTSVLLTWSWTQFIKTPLTQTPVIFIVPQGSSIKSVSNKLHSMEVLDHPNYFIFLAFLKGVTKHIKAGEYQIDAGGKPSQLLLKLAKGKVVLHPFTIVEGWTLKQVLASANNNRFLHHTLNENNIDAFSTKLGCLNKNLEGYLYPDTYLFARNVKDTVIIGKAYALMQKKLSQAWANRDTSLPYKTPYEALIVASLIEKETARADERKKISGVILRRIENGMLLQIDASVIYGLGKIYQGKLTKSDLKVDTPFNNYLHKGLPPSPIAMPSYPSILAALHPEHGTELYYVARGDGSHEFTNSLENHRKAIQKYRLNYLTNDLQNVPIAYNEQDVFARWAQNIAWFETSQTVEKMVGPSQVNTPATKLAPKKQAKKVTSKTKQKKSHATLKPNKKIKNKTAKKGHSHAKH